jgi:type II secretory pathway component PulF
LNDPQPELRDPVTAVKPLSAGEATEFAGRIAELAQAGLPLAPGMRAVAAELPRSRVAAAFSRVAAALDRGESLEQAISVERGGLPKHLEALVTAGVRTGRLGVVLEEFVQFEQQTDDIRRSVWRAMAYPALLILLLIAAVMYFVGNVMSLATRLRKDIDPSMAGQHGPADVSGWVANHGQWLIIGTVAIIVTLIAAQLTAPQITQPVLNRIPILGPLWRFSGLAEWAKLLRVLVTSDVPLPEALKLSSTGIRDRDLGRAVECLAANVESGSRLSDAIVGHPQFGFTARPFIVWGEDHSTLPDALDAVATSAIDRLERRAELIRAIGPPAVFIVVTGIVLLTLQLPGATALLLAPWTVSPWGPRPPPELVWPTPSFSGALGLLFLGWVMLLVIAIVYRRRMPPADPPQILMRLAGWLLMALGALGMLLVYWGDVGVILWLIGVALWGGAVYRFRRSQKFARLNLLSIAADRGMPLEAVVRAIAEEECGRFYFRAMRFADELARGTPLAFALRSHRRVLPRLAFVAARIGEVTGSLGAALRAADMRNRSAGPANEPPARIASYLYLVAILGGIVPYMAIRISPHVRRIFRDFKQELPPLTAGLFNVLSSPWVIAICGVFFFVAVCIAFYALLRELGWIEFDLPIAGRLTAPRDAAPALRLLSIVASQGRPLSQPLQFMAGYYPRRLIRKRLAKAFADIARGGDPATSLRRAKLVGRTDEAILRAAAGAGNLPWALAEAAANGERRANYRLAAIGQILFPLLILAVGAVVMMIVVGWFLPLVALIKSLA